jgi:hypothetical protein
MDGKIAIWLVLIFNVFFIIRNIMIHNATLTMINSFALGLLVMALFFTRKTSE